MSRNEKRRMGIYVVTGIALVAVVAVLSVAVLKKRDSKNAQAQAANPSYMDENGGEYIAAFLKDMTDSTITVDIAEFITDDNTERIKELKLSEEDMPDGYYIEMLHGSWTGRPYILLLIGMAILLVLITRRSTPQRMRRSFRSILEHMKIRSQGCRFSSR